MSKLSVEFFAPSPLNNPMFYSIWPPKAARKFVVFFGQISKANGPKNLRSIGQSGMGWVGRRHGISCDGNTRSD